jgi:hypothetical protein
MLGMKRNRPNVVVAFAILNIVFGVISMCLMMCCGLMEAVDFLLGGMAHSLRPHPVITVDLMYLYAIALIVRFILQAVLTASGIGLMNMRRWARKSSIVCGIIIIAYSVAYLVNIGINPYSLNPEISFTANPWAWFTVIQPSLFSIGVAIIEMSYAIALFVVMLLPSVTAAFAGQRMR